MISICESDLVDSFSHEILSPTSTDQVDNSYDAQMHAGSSEFRVVVEESTVDSPSTEKRLIKRKRTENFDIQDSMDSFYGPEEPISDNNNQISPRSKYRSNLPTEKLAELREKERLRRRVQRASMSDEQRAQQKEINRQREAAYRARFTEEQRMKQREIDRQRQAAFRAALSDEERRKQKEIDRLRKAASRARKRSDRQGDPLAAEAHHHNHEDSLLLDDAVRLEEVPAAVFMVQVGKHHHWTDTESNFSVE